MFQNHEVPLGPDAMKAVGFSIEEAEHMRHPLVGRYHLFIGLIRESHMVPGEPFNQFPNLVPNLREEAEETYDVSENTPVYGVMPVIRVILQNAQHLAHKERTPFVSSDHLLRATLEQELFVEQISSDIQTTGVLRSVE